MWDWWDNTVSTVTDWAGDAWDKVNEVVDTYVWDTTENEAVVESWVRDTFNIPDQEGKGFVAEAGEKIKEVVDPYIRYTAEKEAAADEWVQQMYDMPKQESKGFLEEAAEKLKEAIDEVGETVEKDVNKGGETVTTFVTEFIEIPGDNINNISLALGVGFDAAMAVLGGLPDLIMGLKTDLANWFKFDIKEFQDTMKLMSDAAEAAKEPE